MVTNRLLVVLLMTVSMAALVRSEDLLPFPVCFILELSFKSLGCAGGTSDEDFCLYMSWALRLQLENGQGLCEAMPCIGYDQTGKECTRLFPRSCSSRNRISDGICPVGKECCKK